MPIYTRRGDDGTTGLLFGGRVSKRSPAILANGALDEAQAALGVARAQAAPGSELDDLLVGLERDLYVAMAELATSTDKRGRLEPGVTLVTEAMVARLEGLVDGFAARFPPVREFVVPGHDRLSASLDLARTVIRRAEREAIGVASERSSVVPYLNRLSDLVWTLARWQERGESLPSRRPSPPGADGGRGPVGEDA